ncbi:hypothetical protein JCM10207_006916 [Rhodosporidiobolus poonsookiae]
MPFSSLFSTPTIKIVLEEELVFSRPRQSGPTSDFVLRGAAVVDLPTKRPLKRFKVTIDGTCNAYDGQSGYETTNTLHKEMVQDLKGETFDAGKHVFAFSFIIPSATANSQRCYYGRVQHYVKAKVDFADGVIGQSISSAPTAWWITASPYAPGELPQATELSFEHFSEDLGPIGVGFSSPHLTIASLANLRVQLLGPPKPITILAITAHIEQAFEIRFRDGRKAHPPLQRIGLEKVDSAAAPTLRFAPHAQPVASKMEKAGRPAGARSKSQTRKPPPGDPKFRAQSTCSDVRRENLVSDPFPLAHLEPEEDFRYSRICLIPDDDHVRASTLDGSDAVIRVTHKMCIEVKYKAEDNPAGSVVEFSKPVIIGSCCFLTESLYLPAYSGSSDPADVKPPVSTYTSHGLLKPLCSCTLTLKECFDRDGVALQRAGALPASLDLHESSLIYADSLERANKTPSWTSSAPRSPVLEREEQQWEAPQ